MRLKYRKALSFQTVTLFFKDFYRSFYQIRTPQYKTVFCPFFEQKTAFVIL
jgi:hypothetical protein